MFTMRTYMMMAIALLNMSVFANGYEEQSGSSWFQPWAYSDRPEVPVRAAKVAVREAHHSLSPGVLDRVETVPTDSQTNSDGEDARHHARFLRQRVNEEKEHPCADVFTKLTDLCGDQKCSGETACKEFEEKKDVGCRGGSTDTGSKVSVDFDIIDSITDCKAVQDVWDKYKQKCCLQTVTTGVGEEYGEGRGEVSGEEDESGEQESSREPNGYESNGGESNAATNDAASNGNSRGQESDKCCNLYKQMGENYEDEDKIVESLSLEMSKITETETEGSQKKGDLEKTIEFLEARKRSRRDRLSEMKAAECCIEFVTKRTEVLRDKPSEGDQKSRDIENLIQSIIYPFAVDDIKKEEIDGNMPTWSENLFGSGPDGLKDKIVELAGKASETISRILPMDKKRFFAKRQERKEELNMQKEAIEETIRLNDELCEKAGNEEGSFLGKQKEELDNVFQNEDYGIPKEADITGAYKEKIKTLFRLQPELERILGADEIAPKEVGKQRTMKVDGAPKTVTVHSMTKDGQGIG